MHNTMTGGSDDLPEEQRDESKALPIASRGIDTGKDFAQFMSALMTDLISGAVSPGVGNAACNAGGKLLKVVEMQHRYGTKGGSGPSLQLT